jgi:hypothetical protein
MSYGIGIGCGIGIKIGIGIEIGFYFYFCIGFGIGMQLLLVSGWVVFLPIPNLPKFWSRPNSFDFDCPLIDF